MVHKYVIWTRLMFPQGQKYRYLVNPNKEVLFFAFLGEQQLFILRVSVKFY